jgi:Tol biopolymer transport system component
VAFSSHRGGNYDIFLRQADGSGEAKVLLGTPADELLSDWSRDGKHLLYQRYDPETSADLWYLERSEDGSGWEAHSFLQTPFGELAAKFSPDGRYVAYVSNESGQREVYVRPFPEGGGKWVISSNGGSQPRWSRDGKELLYVEPQEERGRFVMVAVSVSTGPRFSVGSASRLFELPGDLPNEYDISADGQRFLLPEPVGEVPEPTIETARQNARLLHASGVGRVGWIEVEDAIGEVDLFASSELPQLTHGVCPTCVAAVSKEWFADEGVH